MVVICLVISFSHIFYILTTYLFNINDPFPICCVVCTLEVKLEKTGKRTDNFSYVLKDKSVKLKAGCLFFFPCVYNHFQLLPHPKRSSFSTFHILLLIVPLYS